MTDEAIAVEISYIKEKLDELATKLDNVDKKYASAWVEKAMTGFFVTIAFYFIGGLLGLFTIPTANALITLCLQSFT